MNFIRDIRQRAVDDLNDEERATLKEVIQGQQNLNVVDWESTRRFVHNWQLADLLPLLAQIGHNRFYESGKSAYEAAQCGKCHRFGDQGGTTGPDITVVGNRLSPQYLLESLLVPTKFIPELFRNKIIHIENGNILTGRVVYDDGKQLRIRTHPFALRSIEVSIDTIESHLPSNHSEMPEELLNVLIERRNFGSDSVLAYCRQFGR